jgi:hypothetical protein
MMASSRVWKVVTFGWCRQLQSNPGATRYTRLPAHQGLAGVSGLREGQAARLSARVVDDAAAARHARENAPAAGHECLADLVQGTVCKILGQEEVKPHKMRYYLERRDAEFEQKMAEVLCVYREVQVLKKAVKSNKPGKSVAIISYDEKPGIQAIATTAPDRAAIDHVDTTTERHAPGQWRPKRQCNGISASSGNSWSGSRLLRAAGCSAWAGCAALRFRSSCARPYQ